MLRHLTLDVGVEHAPLVVELDCDEAEAQSLERWRRMRVRNFCTTKLAVETSFFVTFVVKEIIVVGIQIHDDANSS